MRTHLWLAVFAASAAASNAVACTTPAAVCPQDGKGHFALIENGRPAAVVSEDSSDSAVQRAAAGFAADLKRVSGRPPRQLESLRRLKGPAVVIGVLGQSPIIDSLVETGKLDAGGLAGQWEAFRLAVVENPWPDVPRALVVVGSDRRGAVYGAYDLSEKIGVSPWYWFADVPVTRRADIYITPGIRGDRPKVKYRGIFINDEDPGLSGWAEKRFGGVNARMYEHVFELILRLKGNYLWPAMWYPKAFNLDDPRNKVLADAMGVVMGTSHHEPMNRAQSEWHRLAGNGVAGGKWDYIENAANLRAFWRGGIERIVSKGGGETYESLITVGMRGDGDAPMAEGTAIELLETIVADQRRILKEVTGKPAGRTPQVWALYKEVQDYYDKGMTVPDDVTLLFADDNWGQIRRLPTSNLDREGGFGVYYHFDYVGVPRNYKWLNTNQIAKIWQQMNLAYERRARDIWIVNVGDIKPMEYPLDFFMKMAWDPEAMTPGALAAFPRQWAVRQFGPDVAPRIGELITTYSQLAAHRKPELIDENTFPIGEGIPPRLDGGRFGELVHQWRALVEDMKSTKRRLDPEQHAAYFQLIEFPILALSNLYEMYYATAWNRRLASHHDPRANHFKNIVESTFKRDAELTAEYHALKDGKWDGIMEQVHMNYVIWNEPTQQTMPSVTHVAADMPLDRQYPKPVFAPPSPAKTDATVLEASEYDRASGGKKLAWQAIPHLGQSKAAVVALPQGQPPTTVEDGVRLEYDFTLESKTDLRAAIHLVPTLDTRGSKGIRFGLSIDDGPVKTLVSKLQPTAGGVHNPEQQAWVDAVINNGHIVDARFPQVSGGEHTLKLWRLDDNVVIEKIVIGPH